MTKLILPSRELWTPKRGIGDNGGPPLDQEEFAWGMMRGAPMQMLLGGKGGGGSAGLIYVGDSTNLKSVTLAGSVSTVYAGIGANARKMAKDISGNILVPNASSADTIQRISPAGSLLNTYTLTTSASPNRVISDSTGTLYVAGNGTIAKISSGGAITDPYLSPSSLGSACYLAIDSSDNLFIGAGGGSSVYKYNSSGTLLATYTVGSDPRGMAFDSSGNLWVVSSSVGTFTKITSGGTVTTPATFSNTGHTELSIDSSDNVYALRFGLSGAVDKSTSGGTVTNGFASVAFGTAMTTDGTNLYVGSISPSSVQKITSSGTVSTLASLSSGPSASGMAFF